MYYLAKNNIKEGPFSLEEILKMQLTKDTLVWKDGLKNWVNVSELVELNKFIINTPPPLPSEVRKTELSQQSKSIYIENIIWGLLFGIGLNFLFTKTAIGGGSDSYPIYLSDAEKKDMSIFFWKLLPYSLLIGQVLFLIISFIQISLLKSKSTTYKNSTLSEQSLNFKWGIKITLILILVLIYYVMFQMNAYDS